ncbi:hypothetical protein HDE_02122 [Halotydeus destructor]|nr:hypothetical protein HDE_02122 [Halotydeus destructor]
MAPNTRTLMCGDNNNTYCVKYTLLEKVASSLLILAQQNGARFDQRDIDHIKRSPLSLRTFIGKNMTEEEALDNSITTLEWRKRYHYHDMTNTDFPLEFYRDERCQYAYLDNGKVIFYISLNSISGWRDMLLRLFVFGCKKFTEETNGDPRDVTMIFDCSDLTLRNLDMKLAIDGLQVPFIWMIGYFERMYILNVNYFMKPFLSIFLAAIPKRFSERVRTVSSQDILAEFGAPCVPDRLGGQGDRLESITKYTPKCPRSHVDIAKTNNISDKDVVKYEKYYKLS